jgi:hypothetical protein
VGRICDRLSHITLRGRWCDVIVLNVDVRVEDKINDRKNSLYEELECVFDRFPKYAIWKFCYEISMPK